MDSIGVYGLKKYGDASFEGQLRNGTLTRSNRTQPAANIEHGQVHGEEYLQGVKHDHFGTRQHQLAAMAFNAMMEFVYARQEGSL